MYTTPPPPASRYKTLGVPEAYFTKTKFTIVSFLLDIESVYYFTKASLDAKKALKTHSNL